MKTPKKQFGFSLKILTLAVLGTFGSAHADEEEIAGYIKPDSSVSIGLGSVNGASYDRSVFGQYSGWRLDGAKLLLDADVAKRNDETGLWMNLTARNLGLDIPELSFSQSKQGDWKYVVEYNEMVRRDPRTINTALFAAGTTTPTVVSLATAGSGRDIDFDIRRKAASLSAEKWLTANLMFEASVKNETRQGARLSGVGAYCSDIVAAAFPCIGTTGAILMLPEQIDSTTKQFEARLNYSGEKFMVSGGYYGSIFTNANGSMNPAVSGNLYNPDGTVLNTATVPGSTLLGYLQQPVALPPDNQAHQMYVSGNYAFTPTTRATFKYALTHAVQNADFSSMGLSGAPAGVGNLGGVLDSSLAQLGLTTHPMAKLTVRGNLYYESKDDKTPLALYNGTSTNNLNSSKKLNGKLDASYQLPDHYRLTLGVDYATVNRSLPVATASTPANSLGGLREDTNELSYRAELRRSMSETLNAAVSYIQSSRAGGSWLNIGTAATTGNASAEVYPMTMEDRKRDKLKLSADWTPLDALSLQFMFENGKDKFSGPSSLGLRDTGMSSYGIDAAFTLSENWKLTGYMNQGNQTLHVDHGYTAELEDVNTTIGLGANGNLSGKLEIGGELMYMEDINHYKLGSAAVGLPDVTYKVSSLKLFGKYAVQKSADIRISLVQQMVQFDEWSWGYNGTPFTYSDNTTVSLQPNQNVTFLGASYIYKFR